MTPEVREVIRKVRDEVLTSEERWTKDENARDAAGNKVYPRDQEAVCWCLNGAFIAIRASTWLALDVFDPLTGGDFLAWNDAPERTFADVRQLLDRALVEEVQQ